MKSTFEKLPKGEVTIKITVETEEFETYHARGLKRVQEMIEIDGFRKGNAPEDQIVKKYGEMIILEETANICLGDVYVKALAEHKLFPIAEPRVTITKLAKGNPFEVSIDIVTLPEVTLGDYKAIAKEEGVTVDELVTDDEVLDVLKELQKGRAGSHADHDHSDHEGHDHADHDHAHEEVELPALDDAFAQSFGGEFSSLEVLKDKVKENLVLEKKQKAQEKRRSSIMEKVTATSQAELSDVIIESELNRMIGQMQADVSRFGGTWDDYLKHAQKTEADIRSDWRKDAERRALTQLVLNEISKKENLTPTEEEIDVELIRLKASFPDADENRAKDYLFQALMNEKVLKFLEDLQ